MNHPSNDVDLTHPHRIVFPGSSITKQDIADYYAAVADRMLPDIVRRPLSILRCPEGTGDSCFFQKHHATSLGKEVSSIMLTEKNGHRAGYLYIEDLRGLLELVQMNTIEFHPWGSRVDDPDRPDRIVFDLDPAPGVEWTAIVDAARDVRDRLAAVSLDSFVRLTGGKGVHVVASIRRGPDWDEVKAFCATLARTMEKEQPQRYLASASKNERNGRIFIDWLRNTRGATSVASWSLRARSGAPVAMPIRWSELGRTEGGASFDLAAARRRARRLRTATWPGFPQQQALPSSA